MRKLLAPLVHLADQVVMVDTGSADKTLAHARAIMNEHGVLGKLKIVEKGDAFVESDGIFHFGNAKQCACDNADCDYVMWLGAKGC